MKFKTTVAQMRLLIDGGMSYVIQLKDGRFIIIDGGETIFNYEQNRDTLWAYLTEKSMGEKPVVAAWFITHCHMDHIDLATAFLRDYREKITVENFAYNFPLEGEEIADIEREKAWKAVMKLYPTAKQIVLRTGDVFRFSNVSINVLTTAFDKYPEKVCNQNQTCAVLKFSFDNGRSFMVLSDSEGDRLIKMLEENSPIYCDDNKLKSDILQVAHHGLHCAEEEQYEQVKTLYEKISPSICFWTISTERFLIDPWVRSPEKIYNKYLFDTVPWRLHFCYNQTTVVDIDDWKITIYERR